MGFDAVAADRDRRLVELPAGGHRLASRAERHLRDRRPGSSVVQRDHAGVRSAARAETLDDLRAVSVAATVELVAGTGDSGLRARGPQAGGQPAKSDRRDELARSRGVRDSAARCERRDRSRTRQRGSRIDGNALVRRAQFIRPTPALGRSSLRNAARRFTLCRSGCADRSGVRADSTDRWANRLVLRQLAVAASRLARSAGRRRRYEARTSRRSRSASR